MSKRIGIIGAMPEEIAALIPQMVACQRHRFSGMDFYEGTLAGVPVVVVQSGEGKVAAALCTQALIDHFNPAQVINTGVAGALDNSLDIGDLVVSVDAVQHDLNVMGLGHEPGYVPGADRVSFPASRELRAALVQAAHDIAPQVRVIEGRVATGDQFVCSHEARQRIIDTFAAHCVEMEGGAIAHVCCCNDVPFVVVRAISDKADESGSIDYRASEEEVAQLSAAIVIRALELLA